MSKLFVGLASLVGKTKFSAKEAERQLRLNKIEQELQKWKDKALWEFPM
jgi:hypothetical protein